MKHFFNDLVKKKKCPIDVSYAFIVGVYKEKLHKMFEQIVNSFIAFGHSFMCFKLASDI